MHFSILRGGSRRSLAGAKQDLKCTCVPLAPGNPIVSSCSQWELCNLDLIEAPGIVSENERYTSELLRQNFIRLSAAFRPMLLSGGYPEEVVDQWIAKTHEELHTEQLHLYCKVCFVFSVHHCTAGSRSCCSGSPHTVSNLGRLCRK